MHWNVAGELEVRQAVFGEAAALRGGGGARRKPLEARPRGERQRPPSVAAMEAREWRGDARLRGCTSLLYYNGNEAERGSERSARAVRVRQRRLLLGVRHQAQGFGDAHHCQNKIIFISRARGGATLLNPHFCRLLPTVNFEKLSFH